MKVICTGATGFIGGAALKQLISNPAVTSIIAITRRAIPGNITSPKLTNIIHTNFLSYDTKLMSRLAGAEACIWALGKPSSGVDIHVGYTMAAVKAFRESLVIALGEKGTFRFVYVSGHAIEADQTKSLWFLAGMRKARGVVENDLVALNRDPGNHWKTFVARPALVTNGESLVRFVAPKYYVPVEELGAALADAAVNGGELERLENDDLRRLGKLALGKKN